MQRDPRNFSPYPSCFWPERWLLATGDPSLSPSDPAALGVSAASPGFRHDEAGFIPFSIGPMNCVGKTLAMQEMRTVVCALVQRFTFSLREGWDSREYDRAFKDYFVSTRPKVPVFLERRW